MSCVERGTFMKIGVLDDDITTLQTVEKALNGGDNVLNNPELRFFTRGKDMLEAVKTERFDCLILDRQLPDMNGDVILQWIRQYATSKFGGYTVVIMLTNMRMETDEIYALKSGVDDYLTKPFKPATLVQRVHRLLQMVDNVQQEVNRHIETPDPAVIHDPKMPDTFTKANIYNRYGYQLNTFTREIKIPSGELVKLTQLEFQLGLYFFKNSNMPIPYTTLLMVGWNSDDPKRQKTMATLIHRLRRLLQFSVDNGLEIRSHYGYGYGFYTLDEDLHKE